MSFFKKLGSGFKKAFQTVIVNPVNKVVHAVEKVEHAGEVVINDTYGGIKTVAGGAYDVAKGITNRAGRTFDDVERNLPLIIGAGIGAIVLISVIKK
jgi:hypothetical protein